jgi:hypothetical protein
MPKANSLPTPILHQQEYRALEVLTSVPPGCILTPRRNLLIGALGTAAAVALPALAAAPVATLAPAEADPIFAAIEHHRRCSDASNVLYCERADLEDALAKADAQEWIANDVALAAASDIEQDAELQLASIVPTTLAGVAALLQLAISDNDGCEWRHLEDDAGVAHPWEYFVTCNCIKAVENLSAAA